MNEIFKGIRPLDYVLAGLMTVAGVVPDVREHRGGRRGRCRIRMSTTSWADAAGLPAGHAADPLAAPEHPRGRRRSPPSPTLGRTCSRSAGSPAAASRCRWRSPWRTPSPGSPARRRNHADRPGRHRRPAGGRMLVQGRVDRHDRRRPGARRSRSPRSSTASASSCRIGSPSSPRRSAGHRARGRLSGSAGRGSAAMSEVFRGIKVRDWLLAGGLTALGVVLMWRRRHDVTDAEVARSHRRGVDGPPDRVPTRRG